MVRILLLLMLTQSTLAQTINTRWIAPTTRLDGTPIEASELTFKVYANSVEVCATAALSCSVPGNWGACTTLEATAIDLNGLEGPPSNPVEVCFNSTMQSPNITVRLM
jgi:hypothetical protein